MWGRRRLPGTIRGHHGVTKEFLPRRARSRGSDLTFENVRLESADVRWSRPFEGTTRSVAVPVVRAQSDGDTLSLTRAVTLAFPRRGRGAGTPARCTGSRSGAPARAPGACWPWRSRGAPGHIAVDEDRDSRSGMRAPSEPAPPGAGPVEDADGGVLHAVALGGTRCDAAVRRFVAVGAPS